MHGDPLAPVLLILLIVLAAAKLGSEIFERLGQPAVLGELIVGLVLGNLVLLNADWTLFEPLRAANVTERWALIIDSLARLGVILLLFEVGLESTVSEMAKVGTSSLLVALVGVIAPFILGFGVSYLFIKEVPADVLVHLPSDFSVMNIHLFIGATLCATSVGITARVLKDLGKLQTKEAKIVLGAAVIDDVLGLIVLAVVSAIVSASITGSEVGALSLVRITAMAIGFFVVAIALGVVVVPRILHYLAKLRTAGMMVISSLLLCFLLSWLADAVGLATIVGAFAAGLILEEVHFKEFKETIHLHELIRPISTLFVPIFFVLMGIQVRLETFGDSSVVGLALGLTVAAIIGKQVCGLAVVEKQLDRVSIGVGMIPRGEVGLIFAGIGKALNIVDGALYSAIVIMVILTTLITPPALKLTIARWGRKR
ncbi:MAG TPA: cation:proton antiporter [Bacteroidota bacterium]|nr:cation:proton antiporter [Bacteroidota bacterium]